MGALGRGAIGADPDVIVDLGLAMLLAGVAGARLLHVFADGFFWDYVHLCTNPRLVDWHITAVRVPLRRAYEGGLGRGEGRLPPDEGADCFAWAKFWAGGLTYYGGFIGASIAAWFLLKSDRFPFWKAADLAGFAVPLGLAFGRMGCLLAGCCFGASAIFPGRSRSRRGAPRARSSSRAPVLGSMTAWSHPVHPTQIYESAASLAIAADVPLPGAAAKALRRAGLRGVPRALRLARFLLEILRRRRSRRVRSASRRRSSSASRSSSRPE